MININIHVALSNGYLVLNLAFAYLIMLEWCACSDLIFPCYVATKQRVLD